VANNPFDRKVLRFISTKHLLIWWFGFSIKFEFHAYRGALDVKLDAERKETIVLSEAYYIRFEMFGLLVKFIFPVNIADV